MTFVFFVLSAFTCVIAPITTPFMAVLFLLYTLK